MILDARDATKKLVGVWPLSHERISSPATLRSQFVWLKRHLRLRQHSSQSTWRAGLPSFESGEERRV